MIIPTPQEAVYQDQYRSWTNTKNWKISITKRFKQCPQLKYALNRLSDHIKGIKVKLNCEKLSFDSEINICFDKNIEHEQGYKIKIDPKGPIILFARTVLGVSYGIASLIQLIRQDGRQKVAPLTSIYDWPKFRFRGNNFLQKAELAGWSYDHGDGIDAYEKRIIQQFDLSWDFKINLILIHGFGWNSRRFPGFPELMRRLRSAAHLRGIRLMYSGMNADYTYGRYSGVQHKNRRSYPNGKLYPCFGAPGIHYEASASHGTCFSNKALLALKRQELEKFVREIEPGVIYIHHVDTGTLVNAEKGWQHRCPDCRKSWPDNRANSTKGLAGAMAHLMNTLVSGINKVENKKRAYKASRDCNIMMMGPIYSTYLESDTEFENTSEYFCQISKMLKYNNISIGMREQYLYHKGSKMRVPILQKKLNQKGGGHRISVIAFYGGDKFYNSHLILPNPVFNTYMDEAELAIMGNGNCYQEPQQIVNAEYLWNPNESSFYQIEKNIKFKNLNDKFNSMTRGVYRPKEIFGKSGLLEYACHYLYGKDAGKYVTKVYQLFTKSIIINKKQKHNLALESDRCSPIWVPVDHIWLPGQGRLFGKINLLWRPKKDRSDWAIIQKAIQKIKSIEKLNVEAVKLMRDAIKYAPRETKIQEKLRWLLFF